MDLTSHASYGHDYNHRDQYIGGTEKGGLVGWALVHRSPLYLNGRLGVIEEIVDKNRPKVIVLPGFAITGGDQ